MKKKEFKNIITELPLQVFNKLEQLKTLRERPDYHPEESCYEHIKIVYDRLCTTNDPDLILSAILHDICKLDCMKISEKTGYPTSPGHDKLSYELIINNIEVQSFIINNSGNVDNVAAICKEHMRFKYYSEMKASKKKVLKDLKVFDKLRIFTEADNMLKDFNFNI